MKKYDKITIEKIGINGLILMENAGKKSAEIIETNIIENEDSIAILCGTGNNGGDGFVIARWLFNHVSRFVALLLVMKINFPHLQKKLQYSKKP